MNRGFNAKAARGIRQRCDFFRSAAEDVTGTGRPWIQRLGDTEEAESGRCVVLLATKRSGRLRSQRALAGDSGAAYPPTAPKPEGCGRRKHIPRLRPSRSWV
ncbi:hypothetical protein TRVL_05464 [Trypanosoma vivax]|nr:hypothetical protein TRVL_05464 [Trypanosoma vivax]